MRRGSDNGASGRGELATLCTAAVEVEAWTRRVFVSTQSVKCAASPDSFNETVAPQGHTIVVAAQAKTCP